ncbi:hypothetical protein IJ579_03990 [bacterium]|nr:hypothetical protein [bacterium]
MLDILSPAVYIPTIFVLLIIIFAYIFAQDAKKIGKTSTKGLPYYDEVAMSVEYITRNILQDGRFKYRNNVDPDITYENQTYNSLRHAGTLYSLYLYEKLGFEKKYHDLRVLSSKYFINRYIKEIDKTKFAVISIPEEENINIPIAKSGAAGIALCALSNLLSENEIDLKILQGLGEFLLSMQSKDGNIYAYYDLDKKEINKEAEAVYYTGEAAAGLVCLYEVDPQQKWLDCAKKALFYLHRTQATGNFEPIFDHWAVFAIEKLVKMNLLVPQEYQLLKDYVEKMAIPMLTAQITNKDHVYFGAFKDNIRPCSLGTIMEGLAGIYFCTDSEQLKTVIYKSIAIGCMFLSRTQVKTGQNAGGLPNSANWIKPGVTPNASVIRIDNVQHVICGWLRFQNILKARETY